MSRKIKLIWDFRGEDALGTAKHHHIHLDDFSKNQNLQFFESGTEEISSLHHIAFLTVDEKDMILVRDALKPHRGVLAE